MDHEGEIFLTEHLVQELIAGRALVIQNFTLAQTSIYKQAEGKRQIAFLRKITNGLGDRVGAESEIVLGKVVDDVVMLVANRGEDVDYIYLHRDIGRNRNRRLC